ncbi:hypothetical protein BLA14095_04743 [Burkholderia lata]|uniref:hypothetical protein n=1 Tax=Burkholderia lata (strain ATCC 17760 / DSM 23089 / LMG 22485 / NCIMB 9086 / R18194 / 383) TaxID=482957 RepID=UPI001453F999|nr:hypothetical protein [Burkholderia lata]VWC00794.1 hypothetical protein BLA14095_04743 [Burkholderia lata]
MLELTTMAITALSVVSRIGSSVLGRLIGPISGKAKGTVIGGANVGLISEAAGMAVGAALGTIGGGLYRAINDAQQTVKAFNDLMGSIFDWPSPTPKVRQAVSMHVGAGGKICVFANHRLLP